MSAAKAKAPTLGPVEAFWNEPTKAEGFTVNTTSSVSHFVFDNTDVRVVMSGDTPWFVAADICRALGIENNRNAISRLDDDERGVRTVDTPSGQQEMGVINESGMYSLILTSRKPEAKKFKRWVTGEVLPTIRKTGAYGGQQRETLSAQIDRHVAQIESGNGAPLELYMPLWAAVNRRLMERVTPSLTRIGGYRQELARCSH